MEFPESQQAATSNTRRNRGQSYDTVALCEYLSHHCASDRWIMVVLSWLISQVMCHTLVLNTYSLSKTCLKNLWWSVRSLRLVWESVKPVPENRTQHCPKWAGFCLINQSGSRVVSGLFYTRISVLLSCGDCASSGLDSQNAVDKGTPMVLHLHRYSHKIL